MTKYKKPVWGAYFGLMIGLFFGMLSITHGAAYFVLSGKWKGDTPWECMFGYALSALMIALSILGIMPLEKDDQ